MYVRTYPQYTNMGILYIMSIIAIFTIHTYVQYVYPKGIYIHMYIRMYVCTYVPTVYYVRALYEMSGYVCTLCTVWICRVYLLMYR